MKDRKLFEAWWYGCEHYHIATFWDQGAAQAFCREINDECQAEVMEIEEIPLIDKYGQHCTARELRK